MKLKNMWKRFWTLDVHNHAGFTLVELIIVIAILAILSTGAIAGYSAYVESANKTADKALIAELESVLTLAIYNDDLHGGAHIVLTPGGEAVLHAGSNEQELIDVLVAAYGANWAKALTLKYDDWKVGGPVPGSVEEAIGVKGSSYLSGSRADHLLTDVESFTNMAANLAGAMGSSSVNTSLGSLFGEELLNETAEKYGIEGPADGDWDTWGQTNSQEFSNLLVLATALDSQKMIDGGTPSESTNLILGFSSYYAFAATNPEFSDILDQKLADLENVETPSQGAAWYSDLQAKADAAGYGNYSNDNNKVEMDQSAFVAIMSALNNTSAEDVANGIGDSNLFTEGAVKGMFDQYISAVEVMADNNLEVPSLEAGQVRITINAGKFSVTSSNVE